MENTTSSSSKRCGVVTGGNKGIGLEICKQLASNGVMVVLTARDEKRGLEAVKTLRESGLSDVVFHQLDVTDLASAASLARFIGANYGKLDILVNNAGVGGIVMDKEAVHAFRRRGGTVTDEDAELLKGVIEETVEKAEECVNTNYYGTKSVTEALLSLLQLSNSPTIVNLSSFYGQLKYIRNEKAKTRLEDVESLTVEELDGIVQWFLRDFKVGKLQENGWPLTVSAYKVSKAAVNAYTRLLAMQFPSFRVNCVHPGLVRTDLTENYGNLSPEEGARGPVRLALLPDNGPSGLYFDEMDLSEF